MHSSTSTHTHRLFCLLKSSTTLFAASAAKRCALYRPHRFGQAVCETFISACRLAIEARSRILQTEIYWSRGSKQFIFYPARFAVEAKARILQIASRRSSTFHRNISGDRDTREFALADLGNQGHTRRKLHGFVADLFSVQTDAALVNHA